jgi:hypothetical protein
MRFGSSGSSWCAIKRKEDLIELTRTSPFILATDISLHEYHRAHHDSFEWSLAAGRKRAIIVDSTTRLSHADVYLC